MRVVRDLPIIIISHQEWILYIDSVSDDQSSLTTNQISEHPLGMLPARELQRVLMDILIAFLSLDRLCWRVTVFKLNSTRTGQGSIRATDE